jgi:hypothetical protein
VLDTSASMKTRDEDGGRSRFEVAVAEARGLLDAMGGGDAAMILRMDGQTTPLSRFVDDLPALRRVLDDVAPSDTPADLRRALSAAADALRGRARPTIVVIGDGAYDAETRGAVAWEPPAPGRLDAIDLSGIDVRYVPVGATAENAGIVAFNVRRYPANKASYEVFIELENFGAQPARRRLVLYGGDTPIDVRHVVLGPGERLRQIYPELAGGADHRLRAELLPEAAEDEAADGAPAHDAFALDDVAWALLPARRKLEVLLVTQDNLYLEGALLVDDNLAVDKLTPAAYDAAIAAGTLPTYAAVVFDGHTPAALPPAPTHLLYFAPSGAASPWAAGKALARPRITQVDPDHPVTRWITMSDVNFDAATALRPDRARGDVVVASAVRDPLIVVRREGGRKLVGAGFDLGGTDLMMRVAFPLLLINTLDWFAGDDADLVTTYRTGTRVRLPLDPTSEATGAEVIAPSGRRVRAPLVDGGATFYAAEAGVHRVVTTRDGAALGELDLAANLASPTESAIAPSPTLELGGRALAAPEGFSASPHRALWTALVVVALALLAIEWLTFHRRVTV